MHSLTLDQFKAAVRAGGVTGVTLVAQGSGFFLRIGTRADEGTLVLTKARSKEPRRFGSPTSAMLVLKDLGLRTARIDFTLWDPEQKEVTNREPQRQAMIAAHRAAAEQRQLSGDSTASPGQMPKEIPAYATFSAEEL